MQRLGPNLTVHKHALANGLGVILLPDRSAPVVAYHTWFRVGSRDERKGKTGIAHLLEHLMFNQTANLEAGEFDRLMETAGGDTNAATWVDWTYYRDCLPASQLELAVRLEADRMRHLTLTDEQVESEREVVANERRFRVDDDVDGFVSEELFRLAYTRHPYHHPTIGWMEDIEAITTDDARRFYERFYSPDNATVLVVGDFDPDTTMALIDKHYGHMQASGVVHAAVPAEPRQAEARRARFAKPVAAERFAVGYHAPGQGDDDWLPLLAVHELLLGGPSARLYRELVIEREIASTAHGMLAPYRDPGLLEIVVNMKRGESAEAAEAAIDAAVARLVEDGVTPVELAKIKNRMETGFWSELESADGKAESLGHYQTTLGDHERLFDIAGKVATLSDADLRRVAAAYLRPEGKTVVVAEPSGEEPLDDEDDEGDAE